MRKPTRPREVGRGERVLPGAWRLRLPLRIPGVPHCNAWALDAGDGIVLVDTGIHAAGSMADLEWALGQAGRRVEDVRLVVITHAHPDHCGQAPEIAARAGCEVWIHPAFRTHALSAADPEAGLAHAEAIGRAAGVPAESLQRWSARRRAHGTGQAGRLDSDRDLLPGVEIATDLGAWQVIETPGHSPSHVCLHQPERRLLISGDHLMGRASPTFEIGFTPDPVGEFLDSLEVVERLGARLALAGHARAFNDIPAHVLANRTLVAERLEGVRAALAGGGGRTAYELTRGFSGAAAVEEIGGWLVSQNVAWLTHLEALGDAVRTPGDAGERWRLGS